VNRKSASIFKVDLRGLAQGPLRLDPGSSGPVEASVLRPHWRKSVCFTNLLVMATESAYAGDDPRRLLSGTQDLARRVRRAQRATWFPLLVLAWAEHNPALLAFTLGYLVIVLVPVDFGWVMVHPRPWFFLPHLVIDGSVLLLGALGFGLAQRSARQAAA
jgi:hypothetical protein